jgi:hypothetical protein
MNCILVTCLVVLGLNVGFVLGCIARYIKWQDSEYARFCAEMLREAARPSSAAPGDVASDVAEDHEPLKVMDERRARAEKILEQLEK